MADILGQRVFRHPMPWPMDLTPLTKRSDSSITEELGIRSLAWLGLMCRKKGFVLTAPVDVYVCVCHHSKLGARTNICWSSRILFR